MFFRRSFLRPSGRLEVLGNHREISARVRIAPPLSAASVLVGTQNPAVHCLAGWVIRSAWPRLKLFCELSGELNHTFGERSRAWRGRANLRSLSPRRARGCNLHRTQVATLTRSLAGVI
jgi:hypothetical protein